MLRYSLLVAILLGSVGSVRAQGKPVSFIDDVAPIFREYCLACHDSKKKSGKYDMTSFAKLLEGGAVGDPVTAGKSAESELYTLLVTAEERRMPPRKDNLSGVPKAKADIVKRWIDEGAKLDGGIEVKADLIKELRVRWKAPASPVAYKYPTIINAMAFTPDGTRLVVGGHQELTVWNVADAKLIKRIHTRAERAYAMAFLADGKLAVAGGRPGQEGDLRVFDIDGSPGVPENGVAMLDGIGDSKVMLRQLLDVDDSVLCLAVSNDGKKLAAGACDRLVRVWEVGTWKLDQTIENHADWVMALAFSPDGKVLFSGSRDKTAKVWDLTAKESLLTFPDHQNTVFGIAVKADGKAGYSVGADGQVRTWNATGDGKQIKVIGSHSGEALRLVAHPTKPILISTGIDKTVKVWDAEKNVAGKVLAGLTDHVFAAAISPDATMVAAGGYDGEVRVWKLADGTVFKSFNASPGYVAPKK